MKITTISESNPSVFDKKVNQLLQEGWELHGPPSVQTVPRHNTWDGKPYSIPETTYTQVLKRNSIPETTNSTPLFDSSASTWQPIETIPRDGTPVLVWAEPMRQPDIAWHEESGTTLQIYTHWMALPKPPNNNSTHAPITQTSSMSQVNP